MAKISGMEAWDTRLDQVEELRVENVPLYVFESNRGDGSYLYFSPTRNLPQNPNRHGGDIARLRYRVLGKEAVFGGILVPTKLAGHNLGVEMIKYFAQFVERRGLDFFRTGTIRKPMIALSLARADFVPVSRDLLVEILPRSQRSLSRIPNIHVIENRESRALTSGSQDGDDNFFRVISKEEVLRKYPINAPENIVAICTRYIKRSAVGRATDYYQKRTMNS